MSRHTEFPVAAEFLDRWSPRQFTSEPLDDATIGSLFEAARWAPSCNNEQPWLFIYGTTDAERAPLADLLTESNKRWAHKAPLIGFVVARRDFTAKGTPNRWAAFDCGSAWMSLALEARRLGLFAHGMGGFDQSRSYGVLSVDEKSHEVIAAFVVGRHTDPSTFTPEQAAKEIPNTRKPHGDLVRRHRP